MSQLKIKNGNEWVDIPAGGVGVPSGGNAGDVLVKSSSTDYATEWVDFGTIFYDEDSAEPTISGNSSSDGNLSLSLSAGLYLIIVNVTWQSSSSSERAYATVGIEIDGTQNAFIQAHSLNYYDQVPMTCIKCVNLASASTVKAKVSAITSQSIQIINTHYIQAVKLG